MRAPFTHIHPSNHRRLIPGGLSVALAVGWSFALCYWPVWAEPWLLILNGLLVGIYGGGLGVAHPGPRGPACIVTCWVLGMSHPIWMLPIGALLQHMGVALALAAGVRVGDAALFVGTGLVFAVAMALATRWWWTAVPILAGTAASAALAAEGPQGWSASVLALACAPLHLGIAIGLACSAWRALRSDWPSDACPRCHYSLVGNTTGLCPECGTPFARYLDLNPRPK